tara:strand:+ start:923 stop:1231 length:309 start_codon:yes stop_codon:yes gene_type:complete
MIWILIIIAGIITFMMRYSLIALIKPENLNDTTKKVLSYVSSAVFPAMIFPAVFFNKAQTLQFSTFEVYAFICALIVGYISKNTILTIISGLASYWIMIFFL